MRNVSTKATVLVTPTACSSKNVFRELSDLVAPHELEVLGNTDESVLANAIGIWVRQDTLVDSKLLDRLPNIRFVATTTTSVVHVNTETLRARGISLLHLTRRDSRLNSITSTVDHTWAMILHLHGRVAKAHDSAQKGRWTRDGLIRDAQLSSLTLGVVGAGRIGFRVANVGLAFGMRVCIFDPSEPVKQAAKAAGMAVCKSLDELFGESNYVSLHATSSPGNFSMINRKVLERGTKVQLFNTARGELVDEQAVIESLREAHLSGYHTDVLVSENQADGIAFSPIYTGLKEGLPITLTPHIGGSSLDAMEIAESIILNKIIAFLKAPG